MGHKRLGEVARSPLAQQLSVLGALGLANHISREYGLPADLPSLRVRTLAALSIPCLMVPGSVAEKSPYRPRSLLLLFNGMP